MINKCDVVIIGAGAAGMMCAIEAGKRGRKVVLLDHAKKIGEKIRENKEKGILSKHLATIITDVPLEFDEKSLELEPADREKVMSIFQDLEFKTLGKRLFDSPSTSPAGQTSLFDESGDESMSSIFQSIETVEHNPYRVSS